VSFYERHILPRVLDLSCGMKAIQKQREKVVPKAHGRVLEVGIGSGLNLAHYDRERISALIGLDPSPELRRIAEKRARSAGVEIEWLPLEAERIPLDDASVDSVVVTYTLCTIADVAAALTEMRRVLMPGGALYFSEHGRAPDPRVASLQDRLSPYWQRFAGGCRLNRDVSALIADAGFEFDALDTMYLPRTPRAIGHTFWGSARRPASS
jgi:ubiquinone/menaquinone biosynthesis C-methylase UbiE